MLTTSILSALVLAILSGITFLAVNHLKTFTKIFNVLYTIIPIVIVIGLSYDYGIFRIQTQISTLASLQVDVIINKQYIPYLPFVIITGSFLFYLKFLLWLGKEIEKNK